MCAEGGSPAAGSALGKTYPRCTREHIPAVALASREQLLSQAKDCDNPADVTDKENVHSA